MSGLDSSQLLLVALGIVLGYTTGRYLWQRRAAAFSPWIVIAIVAIGALITSRLFAVLGIAAIWQATFFPFLVGWGAGLSVTRARPPLRSAWWQLWRA